MAGCNFHVRVVSSTIGNCGDALWHEVVKLFYLIPCHNHAGTVGKVIADLPREVAGFDSVACMVVDAGSTDGTVEAARRAGVDVVVRLPVPRGIVNGCIEGLHRCLALDADAVVILDPQGLYAMDAIPALVAPIVNRQADLVVGDRGRQARTPAAPVQRLLHAMLAIVLRALGGVPVADPQCAFRALSRDAAMRLSAGTQKTFAESVIRAGHMDLPMASVPVTMVGAPRSAPSTTRYLLRAGGTVLRVFLSYQPFKAFAIPGSALALGGVLIGSRFVYAYLSGLSQGMVQSMILAMLLLSAGAFLILCGVLAELLSTNRALEEDLRFRLMNLQGRLGRAARRKDAAT